MYCLGARNTRLYKREKIMNERENTPKSQHVHLAQVKSFVDFTPRLRRITFYANEFYDYPPQLAAAHIKLFFPHPGQTRPDLPIFSEQGISWPSGAIKPIVRTYTVRDINPAQGELSVEFVLHDVNSPATNFAEQIKKEHYIGMSQPKKAFNQWQYDTYYFIGDESALPAIVSILERLPPQVTGEIFLQITSVSAKRELIKPQNMIIHWIIDDVMNGYVPLIIKVKQQNLILDHSYVWLAGENDLVIALRHYLRKERDLPREQLYAIPYWKKDVAEEQYHLQRHHVMDQDVEKIGI